VNFDFHNITGFDISKWQGAVSFQKMKAGGASFVIVKAGQGNWADPMFETNWRNAKGVLPRSSYWYYDNRYPPDAQARKYFDILRGDLEGMCWLDLEDRNAGVYQGWQGWYDFLEEFKAVYPGARLGIYSNFFYIVEMLSFATRAQRDYFGQYPFWLANYGLDAFHPDYSTIMVPLPWLEPLILQSGTPAIGLDAGVESLEIDFNQFNGDAAKFQQYFGSLTTTLPPTDGGETEQTMKGTVKTFTNIRLDHNKNSADMGDLLAGDVVTWAEEYAGLDGLTWIKLITATHNGAPIKCVDGADVGGRYCWANNVALDAEPEPEPTPAHVVEVTVDGVVVFRKELA
jgi:GH25 family lysozyme M1 (1,4-beta-N-acetylmuramidase)